jgi:hypothetical protein
VDWLVTVVDDPYKLIVKAIKGRLTRKGNRGACVRDRNNYTASTALPDRWALGVREVG